MKRHLLIATTLLLFAQTSLGSQLPLAVAQYLDNPTEENAKIAVSAASRSISPIDLSSTDLLLIRNQVVAGSLNGLRLVLTLIPISDGGNLEDLMTLAAAAIRPQPNTFLRVVQDMRLNRKTLESILQISGSEYVDRPVAKRLELELRRAAISGSTHVDLSATQALCIQLLDSALNR